MRKTSWEETLIHIWSVSLPRWLAPWAPRLADAVADGVWTAVWSRVAAYAPLAALVVGFLTPLLWPGMHEVYSESLLFLMLVIGSAILSGSVGMMLLIGYVLGDLFWGINAGHFRNYPLYGAGGLLVSYLLLALPAVVMPLLARGMADEVSVFLSPRLRRISGLVLFPAICALQVFLWAHAVVLLIRPFFTWTGRDPSAQAITPVQTQWQWLVATAIAAAVIRLTLEGSVAARSADSDRVPRLIARREQGFDNTGVFWERLPAWVRVALRTALITLILAGTYTSWFDGLFVALVILVASGLRTGVIGKATGAIQAVSGRAPHLLRVVAAVLIGYLTALAAVQVPLLGLNASFRGIMLGALITAALLYTFSPSESPRPRELQGGLE